MNDVIRAFLRAFRDQLHPSMLMLALLPFFGALLLWGGLLWWYWDPISTFLREWLLAWSWLDWLNHTLTGLGLESWSHFLVPLLIALVLLPLVLVTAILLVGGLAMPTILNHIDRREHEALTRLGTGRLSASIGSTLSATAIFLLGWLVTLPLWLIPPLSLVLPFFWLAYLNLRIMSFDALAEHASDEERRLILERHAGRLWMLAIFVTLFCSIPLMWLVAPVFSALAFAHYQLHALRGLRSARAQGEKVIH
ncbi:MAG: EI24 domain-containing protein [Burkholderiaceae bacterium]|nr:MAG: EI24 domain-containing protein [Burkholderiaceae bacterium]